MNRPAKSQQRIPKTTLLPKINKLIHPTTKHSLLKQLKPYKQQSSQDEDDTTLVINRMKTPPKKHSQVQIVFFNPNQNKKNFLQKQYIKESLVGQEAIQKFYQRYKKIDKAKAIQNFMQEDHPITKIVDLLEGHNFAPRKLDVIKLKGSQATLDLRKLGLGQGSLGPVVAELVEYFGKFQSVDLSHNRIDRNIAQVLLQRSHKVKKLNLAHNRVGKNACTLISQLFLSNTTLITHLNLRDNNLLDNAGVYIINNLLLYKRLKYLNLSKNFMGAKFSIKLKQVLLKDEVLEELYVSWNEFGEKGTRLIFEGIESNKSLRVLDFSWNSISFLNAETIGKAFKNNTILVHVDLSFCDIDKKSTGIIANLFTDNHTIYGFHYEGNSGIVDNRGYLRTTQKQHFQYPLPIVRGVLREIDGVKPNSISNEFKEDALRDICWICQSWQQIHLVIDKKLYPKAAECFFHLESEKYKGIKMNEGEDCFEAYRMCPIGQINLFFTVSNGPGKKQNVISNNLYTFEYNDEVSYTIGSLTFKNHIQTMNKIDLEYSCDPITQLYSININTVPRSIEVQILYKQQTKVISYKKVIIEEKLDIKFRNIDDINDPAFFNDYNNRDDDKSFIKQCLDFDIANSKVSKILKKPQDMDSFKKIMNDYYVDFKDTYYYLANSCPNNIGIYSIPDYAFDKFLEEQKYITKRVTHAKIMVKLYSCLSTGDEETTVKKNDTSKLLNRPQFLEFLVRLALQKWCTFIPKTKVISKNQKEQQPKEKEQKQQDQQENQKKLKIKLPLTFEQGFQRTLKTLIKFSARVRASNWRKKKYLTVQIHTVIKGYESVLMSIYDKYVKTTLGRPKKLHGLMVLDDFKNIFIDAQIKRTRQAMKQAQFCFLDSKRLQVEDSIIQYGLNYDQFIQCLARYSQYVWFSPIADEKNAIWQFQPNRKYVPLFLRYQSLIVNIYRRIPDIQNQKMIRIMEYGLFKQELQILPDKILELSMRTTSNFSLKVNTLEPKQEQQITLKGLVESLKLKYKDAVVKRQQIQSFQQIQQDK